ncbi:hypothetical protein, partial [Helicobacter pylori]|uniref:hypothetical protein n=1 Tax=Helicobacter pylori TaxID=210 RepID=UPI0030BC1189
TYHSCCYIDIFVVIGEQLVLKTGVFVVAGVVMACGGVAGGVKAGVFEIFVFSIFSLFVFSTI